MMLRLLSARLGMLVLCILCLSGCSGFFDNPADEEYSPLVADALARKAALNYTGAIESLEKALEANPKLARPHWELGLIYYEHVKDPAAAIYHFQKLLKLNPNWRQADSARRFIEVCKIELAKTAPLGPQTPQVQRVIDTLTARQVDLNRENTQLKEALAGWHARAQQLASENLLLRQQLQVRTSVVYTATASPTPAPPAAGSGTGAQAQVQVQPRSTAPAAQSATGLASASVLRPSPSPAVPATVASNRPPVAPVVTQAVAKPAGYVVLPGDTLVSIARRRGVTVEALRAANPQVTPKRLLPGQVLRLP